MLDEMDVKILKILQQNCTHSVADIGKEVGLSTTPCWRRNRRPPREKRGRSRRARPSAATGADAMNGAVSNIGVPPLEALKGMSGLDFLQRIADGRLPQPPITETLGFRLAEVSPGF